MDFYFRMTDSLEAALCSTCHMSSSSSSLFFHNKSLHLLQSSPQMVAVRPSGRFQPSAVSHCLLMDVTSEFISQLKGTQLYSSWMLEFIDIYWMVLMGEKTWKKKVLCFTLMKLHKIWCDLHLRCFSAQRRCKECEWECFTVCDEFILYKIKIQPL